MNVLIVGNGGREHALTWKALQSPLTRDVFCAPGNAGTAPIAVNIPIQPTDATGISRLVRERGIDLTVIGPEAAVSAGVADAITATGGLVFGPTAAAGRLESSKAFAKELMEKAGVPTPAFKVFSEAGSAKDYVRGENRAFVVKADGLAKGKGTLVPRDVPETLEAIDTLMVTRSVGAAADRILLEEKLEGKEVSVLALVDGETLVSMVPACDYKRALDGDHGPNTGGMGGYSPPGFFGAADLESVRDRVFQPVIDAMRAAGNPYRGCLYAGLMMGPNGFQVLEFNARFGDPEAQVILPRLAGDLIPALEAAAAGRLKGVELQWSPKASVGVVLASRGYPGSYESGHRIEGLFRLEPGVFAFQAGTASTPDGFVTAGGRVLTVVALGESIGEARDRAYRNVELINFMGVTFRRDIAERELQSSTAT